MPLDFAILSRPIPAGLLSPLYISINPQYVTRKKTQREGTSTFEVQAHQEMLPASHILVST